jgi:superfamily II DNA/RNA helicase
MRMSNISLSLEKLRKANLGQYLCLDGLDAFELDVAEIRNLLTYASMLSLSTEGKEISLAYEICTRLLERYAALHPQTTVVSDMILSRIGNFPGRTLLRSKFLANETPQIPISLAVERIARESENSLDEKQLLTDFQYELYTSLGREKSLSVSAPTSAGKSHVLNLDLIRRLRQTKSACIVYLVPTRALISEVVSRIRLTLRQEGLAEVVVRTAPFLVSDPENVMGVVYVLTQERMLRLIAQANNGLSITALVIDEAHEIQKGKRGILLQNAIDLVLKAFPKVSVLFASPLIKNPGYLLGVFGRLENGKYFTEEVSPVAQNVLLVSEVKGKVDKVKVDLLVDGVVSSIGEAKLSFRFRNSKTEQKARFVLEVCKQDESIILFCDDASVAENCALTIAGIVADSELNDEIKNFISFVKSEIHPEYPLIECLRNGVAFHYGNMPSIVRNGVERLFKDGKIRYLCSTSTLLQGVNLPAKHIVIENPHLGEEPMGRADFRNLAGRAGRLLKEFHGNVWCLRPGLWEVESYKGESLQEIRSAMDEVMVNGGQLISAIRDGFDVGDQQDLADAAYSRLYHEVLTHGIPGTINAYKNEKNEEVLIDNVKSLSELKITIPQEILDAHRSLRPDLLQRLHDKLDSLPEIENAVLVNPHERGGKARMQFALSQINEAFDIGMADKYFGLVSGLAHSWVWGRPIGEMIGERVSYVRQKEPNAEASGIIRSLLKVIETEVRYKLVKNFAAYEDLLQLILRERYGSNEVQIAPYHIYLEFGSSDSTTLGLMTLGLSRFTAIKLKSALYWSDEREPEEFLKKIRSYSVDNLPIPELCRQEIYEILGA